jgi:GNAT superfamily N-acetyltransferase
VHDGIRVRSAIPADAADACAIIRRSITELCLADHHGDEIHLAKWLSNKTPENVARWIAGGRVIVAEEAGSLLGVAAMNDTGKILLNYVSPDARFRGVSKALMQHLEERAVGLGLNECILETSETALRFYLSLGYVKTDLTYTLPLTGVPAVVLRKKLVGY